MMTSREERGRAIAEKPNQIRRLDERFNGEVRDREKVMRGLETKDSPILAGYQIYHNYIKPHEALDNRTPVEAAGIEVKGKDKWLTIIQNAKLRNTDLPTD